MAKAPTQLGQLNKMKVAQARAVPPSIGGGRRPMPMPANPGGDRKPIIMPAKPGGGRKPMPMPMPALPRSVGGGGKPMPMPGLGSAIGSMTGTRPGGKGGPRPMGPGQIAQMANLADMAGMQRMKGGGYLKKNIDGKASKGKTKGRNC